jgi:hypothetical protein
MQVGLAPPGFGFVLVVPGYPPRVVPGVSGDSGLTREINRYLREIEGLAKPNRARS